MDEQQHEASPVETRAAPAADGAAIEVRGLVKSFGEHRVLDGIDLRVAHGEILGFVGPNGAGKSTTVRILCGLLGDYDGEARVAGFDPREQPVEVKRRVGYVAEQAVLYEALTVAEMLLFVGRLHGLDDALVRERADTFLEVFELSDRLGSRIAALSKGMRQKVLITAALLHDPRVLFLDEPLSGLDVNSALLVKELMRALVARGCAIFYCSHVMDVVERVCDRIVILDRGQVAAEGTFAELRERLAGSSLEGIFAELTGDGDTVERAARLVSALDRSPQDRG